MAGSGRARPVLGAAHARGARAHPGGRWRGRQEAGELAGWAPLCGTEQKRGPGQRGRGVTPSERRFFSDTPDLTRGHLDFGCGTVGIAGRRAVCLSAEGKLQVSGAELSASPVPPAASGPRVGSQFAGGLRRVHLFWTFRRELWALELALGPPPPRGDPDVGSSRTSPRVAVSST